MEIQFNAHGMDRLAPGFRNAFAAIYNEAHAWAIDEHGAFVQTHLSGRPGLQRWTGDLTRSFVPIWETDPNSVRSGFRFLPKMKTPAGEIDNYAGIHETGGDIRPKNGKCLAWPVRGGPAMTSGGRSKFTGPRQYPGKLFVHRAASGNRGLFLAESKGQGKNAKLVMVYNLATSVHIPARLGFRNFALTAARRGERRLIEARDAAVAAMNAAGPV
jgi:hypothetical protein